jgi:hypothetical protein
MTLSFLSRACGLLALLSAPLAAQTPTRRAAAPPRLPACAATAILVAEVKALPEAITGGGFGPLLRCDRPAALALVRRWLEDPDIARRAAALPALISLGASAGVSCDSLRTLVADSITSGREPNYRAEGDTYASRAVLAAGAVGCTGDQQLDLIEASVAGRDDRSMLIAHRFPRQLVTQLRHVTAAHFGDVLPRLVGSSLLSARLGTRPPTHLVLTFAPVLLRPAIAGDSSLGVFLGRWLFDPTAPSATDWLEIADSSGTTFETFVRVVRAYRTTAAPFALARLRMPASTLPMPTRPPGAPHRTESSLRLRHAGRGIANATAKRAYVWATADAQLALVATHLRRVSALCQTRAPFPNFRPYASIEDMDQDEEDAKAQSEAVHFFLTSVLPDGWSDPAMSAYLRELTAHPIDEGCLNREAVPRARAREK